MTLHTRTRAWLALAALALIVPSACDGGIVGGECRSGSRVCGGSCVDTETDANHCGECDASCEPGDVCSEGECGPPGGSGGRAGNGGTSGDAGFGGAGEGGEPTNGGTSGNAGRGGTSGTSGTPGTAGSGGEGGAVCLPPFDTADRCGDCDTQCAGNTPLCAPDDMGGFECVPMCPPPLEACGDQCVDTLVHPLHCGGCFNFCPSGICQDGECVGASPGHTALYCMDYSYVQQQSAHTILLGNAIFLPVRSDVRILAFTAFAPAAVRSQVNRAIGWAAQARGRTFSIDTLTVQSQLSARLNIMDYDVFLVYDQASAPAGQLAAIGNAWGTSLVLDSFARAGGVIVVLDGAQGTGEMDRFIDSAGLLALNDPGHVPIALDDTTTRFYNRSPGDAVGINVISPLSPVPYSCTFDTVSGPADDTVFVITDATAPALGTPAVVHRISAP